MLAFARNPCRPKRKRRDDRIRLKFPQDLTKLTAEQVAWCVAYHAAMPLAEIRRRQRLTDRQISMAWQQRNDFALSNLRVREEILRRAAERKLSPIDAVQVTLHIGGASPPSGVLQVER